MPVVQSRFYLWLMIVTSIPAIANEIPCNQAAADYQYGGSVGLPIEPETISSRQYQQIHSLFRSLAKKYYRRGVLEDFYCKKDEKHPETYKVKTDFEYDYEGLLFLRGESLSSTQNIKQFEWLRLKLLPDALLLWGLNAGTDIDLITLDDRHLVYREVRRTRKAGGGFTERQVVTEISLKSKGFTVEERFYIKAKLYSWRLWRY
jgi:hypothetical protein